MIARMLGMGALAAVLLLGPVSEAASRRKHTQVSGVLNLNTATAAQLDQLPGIGEKAARRIIEHRSKTPFTRPEELVNVKGFGKKRFEKLKPHLVVRGETNLKVKAVEEVVPLVPLKSAAR